MDSGKLVNGVPTRFLLFGQEFDQVDDVKVAVIVIPGNPGTIEYYREFMGSLHSKLQSNFQDINIPVWGISHAGHQIDQLEFPFPSLKDNPELYNLNGQIQHKTVFLNEFIQKHIKLIFIGHSIGCKITMEALKTLEDVDSRVIKCYMLFPTIERMAETPNGKFLAKVNTFQSILHPLLWTITALPTFIHKFILELHFFVTGRKTQDCVKSAALQLFNKDVVDRVISMGHDELATVVDLDEEALEKYLDKLYFYFGTTDDWCPLHYVEDMKKKFPTLNHQICEQSMEHAFVIKSSFEMAEFLHSKISTDIKPHV